MLLVLIQHRQFINITGQVKRPAIYEIIEGETLDDLLNLHLVLLKELINLI